MLLVACPRAGRVEGRSPDAEDAGAEGASSLSETGALQLPVVNPTAFLLALDAAAQSLTLPTVKR